MKIKLGPVQKIQGNQLFADGEEILDLPDNIDSETDGEEINFYSQATSDPAASQESQPSSSGSDPSQEKKEELHSMTGSVQPEAEPKAEPEAEQEIEIEFMDDIKPQDFEDTLRVEGGVSKVANLEPATPAPAAEKKNEELKQDDKEKEVDVNLDDTLVASPVSPIPTPHPPRYDELFAPLATSTPKRHFSPLKAKSARCLKFVPVKLISPMQTRGVRSAKRQAEQVELLQQHSKKKKAEKEDGDVEEIVGGSRPHANFSASNTCPNADCVWRPHFA